MSQNIISNNAAMQEYFNKVFYFAQDNITEVARIAADLRPEMDEEIQNFVWKYHTKMDALIGEEMTLAELENRINNIIREFGEGLDELLGT